MEIEWLYNSVAFLESKIWQRKESILKNAESILKIAKTIADVGAKSVNHPSTNFDNLHSKDISTCSLIKGLGTVCT